TDGITRGLGRYRLTRKMHHDLGARRLEGALEICQRRDIAAMHGDLLRDRGQVDVRRLLEGEAVDFTALRDESLGEMAASEAGDAGDEHATGHVRTLRGGHFAGERQSHRERAAFALDALDLHGAAVLFGDLPDDGQSDAATADPARDVGSPSEALEDASAIGGRDPDALVADREHRMFPTAVLDL